MYKITFIVVFLSVWTIPVLSQRTQTEVDSISYQYFVRGEWDKLIATGEIAKDNHIDFKYLQQRLGYAFFMQGKYYASIRHYENALAYDTADEITQLYLYYNHINLGNYTKAAYHAGKLPAETRKSLNIKLFKPFSSVDYEFNLKKPINQPLREDAMFHKLGLGSQINSQLSIYQSISTFGQLTDYTKNIRQNEYYGLVTYTPVSSFALQLAFHDLNTKLIADPDTFQYKGQLWFGKITYNKGRFDIGLSNSFLNLNYATSNQLGLQGGIGFSGHYPSYLKSSLYLLTEAGTDLEGYAYNYNRFVFQQTAGMMFFKRLWMEGSITLGDLNNFADFNGMYVYNTADPTIFKSGGSLYFYPASNWIFYLNYAYEVKNILLYNLQYQQNSFTGGIIWKI